MAAPLLQVDALTKYFAGLCAVNEVTFDVMEGEFIGLIGPNGAGKTTCFNLLTGFLPPSSGRIHFNGDDITGKNSHEITHRGMARTFQIVRPFGELTVLENVVVPSVMARRAGRLGDRDVHEWASEMLYRVGLDHRLHEQASNLPHGELKRMEIARALATRPQLLLLDEPFGGLSHDESDALERLIRDLFEEEGLTIILVEHVLQVLMSLSQRVLVLNYGQLIASGTPNEISNDETVIKAYLGAEYKGDGAAHPETVGGGSP